MKDVCPDLNGPYILSFRVRLIMTGERRQYATELVLLVVSSLFVACFLPMTAFTLTSRPVSFINGTQLDYADNTDVEKHRGQPDPTPPGST
jgi:hypothetical protein